MKKLRTIGKVALGVVVILLAVVISIFEMSKKSLKKAFSRKVTCQNCIVGVLEKVEYSDKICTVECNNCEYSEKC